MGAHSTPRGEKSTAQGHGHRSNPSHKPKHAVAGSDTSASNSSTGTPKPTSRLRVPRWLGGR